MLLTLAAVMILGSSLFAQQSTDVVSEINGQKITRADLEKAQGNKLLQARYQYYQAELKALDEYIENKLLEDEARKRNMSVDELLDKEVVSKVQNPTDEQLQFFYDDLNVKDSFANLRDKIFDHVRQRRIAKLRAAFIESIRTKSEVLITLAPPSADFPLEGAPRLGPENAPVRLVEFADYQCPYCAKVNPHIAKLRQEFGDKVSVYFKDLPLQMHANARKAAEAARCAGDQNKYWEYHDQLFKTNQLEPQALKQMARDMKLDGDKFDKCLDEGAQAAAVQKDLADAQQLGLSGTPAFFLNGQYFSGAVDYNTIRDMVNQQLTKVQRASN
ncbi:MAG TPA: thioredoxin domain-containing protein [Terriglobales bacterium]|nr:thioredoxin domain-containing protein [Terriglobales bacterium]